MINGTQILRDQRGLRSETIDLFQITVAQDGEHFRFPIREGGPYKLKRFAGEGPKGRWGSSGHAPSLYGLPGAQKLAAGSGHVFLLEGEPDVWVAQQCGIPAFTFTKGAGYDPLDDDVQQILDSGVERICIIYDLDDDGRIGAQKVAKALRRVGLQVEVLLLPEKVGEKGDVTDLYRYLEFDDERLQEAIYELPILRETSALEDALPKPLRAIDVKAEPPEWLIEDFLLLNEPSFAVGDGGGWKSTVWLHVAGAIAGDYSVFNRFPVRHPGPSLIVSEEDGAGVLRNRLEALCAGQGWDADRVMSNVHLFALEGCSLDNAEWREHLLQTVEDLGVRYVVFDPYRELTGAAENSSDENAPNVRFFRELCTRGVTVTVVHHFGKKVEGKRSLDRIRGSSALASAARVIWQHEKSGDSGVTLHNLKLSRAVSPPPFLIQVSIESEGTSWISARLNYQRRERAKMMRAEEFVLSVLERSPGSTTTDLKKAATDHNRQQPDSPSISAVDVSNALRELEESGSISAERGSRNSKHWHLVSLPSDSEQARQADDLSLPSLPELARASSETPSELAQSPMGMGKLEVSVNESEQAEHTDPLSPLTALSSGAVQ